MSHVAQLDRLAAMTAKILTDLQEPYGATLEQTVQDTRRHKAATAKTRPEARAELFAQLERAERHLPTTGNVRPLTGAMASSLATIAQAALGVRYTHDEEESRATYEAALLRLYASLEAAEKTLVV